MQGKNLRTGIVRMRIHNARNLKSQISSSYFVWAVPPLGQETLC